MRPIPIRMNDDEIAWLDTMSKRTAENRSEIVRQLIRAAMPHAPVTRDLEVPDPKPERIPEVEALIAPDSPAVDAAMARHPAGKRRHDGHRTDTRSGGSCSGCRDCRGWSPIVAGGMRCKCGHPVRMH